MSERPSKPKHARPTTQLAYQIIQGSPSEDDHEKTVASEAGDSQLLTEEKLREEQYPHIIFRDSSDGRQASVIGTGLAVWEIMLIARGLGGDVSQTASHLAIPETLVRAALNYASDFHEEINPILTVHDATDFEALKRLLPDIERVTVPWEPERRRS
jgi:hypothetical protein